MTYHTKFWVIWQSVFCSATSLASRASLLHLCKENYANIFDEFYAIISWDKFSNIFKSVFCSTSLCSGKKSLQIFSHTKWRIWCIYLLTHIFANILKVSLWLIDPAHCSPIISVRILSRISKTWTWFFYLLKVSNYLQSKYVFIYEKVGFVPNYICKGNLC